MQIEPNGLERQLRRQGWRPDALATLAWEKKFAAEATRLGLLPELDFLLDVLPGRRASLLPFLVEGSAAALRQTDRWLNTGGSQISEIVLQASGDLMLSAEGANPLVGFVAEAPLAAALCARLPANRAGGLDAGKSLWLMARRAGAFNGREGAERVLADALRKAGSDPGWLKWLDHVVPAAQNLDVLNWLQQAALRAVRPLPAALNQDPKIDAQRIVVEALHRLMQTPPAVSRAATLLPYLDPGLEPDMRSGSAQVCAIVEDTEDLVEPDLGGARSTRFEVPGPAALRQALQASAEPTDTGLWSLPSSPPPTGDEGRDAEVSDTPDETPAGESQRRSNIGFRSGRANQYLYLSNDTLQPAEARWLASRVAADLANPRLRLAAAVVCLGLSLGLDIDETLALRAEDAVLSSDSSAPCYWHHVVHPEPNAYQPSGLQVAALRPRRERLRLVLPTTLAQVLQQLGLGSVSGLLGRRLAPPGVDLAGDVRNYLTDLRAQGQGRYTTGRIGQFRSRWLYERCRDAVAVHLLRTSVRNPPQPGAYYRAMPADALEALHFEYISALGPEFAPVAVGPAAGHVGSHLNFEPQSLKRCIDGVRDALRSRWSDPAMALHRRHNAWTAWQLFALLGLTGHRPGDSPVESLDLIDLQGGWAIIDDKASFEEKSHRIVPLCPAAVQIMEAQRRHMRAMSEVLAHSNLQSAQRLSSAVVCPDRRLCPLFTFLDESGDIVNVSTGTWGAELGEHWLHPMNWARHFLSTTLHERAIDDSVASALLGHFNVGTQLFSELGLQPPSEVFAKTRQVLQALAHEFGLTGAQAFTGVSVVEPGSGPAPRTLATATNHIPPRLYGREFRREARRASMAARVADVQALVDERLRTLALPNWTQATVDDLFTQVSARSGNARGQVAFERLATLRSRLTAILSQSPQRFRLRAAPVALQSLRTIVDADVLATRDEVLSFVDTAVGQRHRLAVVAARDPLARKAWACALLTALVTECLVLDPAVWAHWFKSRQHEVFLDRRGFHWLRMHVTPRLSQVFAITPELAKAMAAISHRQWQTITRATWVDFLKRVERQGTGAWMPGSPEALCRALTGALAIDLPGLVLHGTACAATLYAPRRSTYERAHGGVSQHTLDEDAQSGADEEEDTDDDHGSRDVVAARPERERRFVAAVNECFAKAGKGELAEPPTTSADQHGTGERVEQWNTQRLDRLAQLFKKRGLMNPDSPELHSTLGLDLVACFRGLATTPYKHGKRFRLKTLQNYWSAIGERLCEALRGVDHRELLEADFEELFAELIEFKAGGSPGHVYAGLRAFHRHLRHTFGLPNIDWGPLARLAGLGSAHVDANLVYQTEYEKALALLLNDPQADPRIRCLQGSVFIFMYRAGLRVGEACALRVHDVFKLEGRWHLRIVRHIRRELKTTHSHRLVALLETLTESEQRCLATWSDSVALYEPRSGTDALFARHGGERELFPRWLIARRIADALRAATADSTLRPHHLRHSFASRMLARLLDESDVKRDAVVEGLIGTGRRRSVPLLFETREPASMRALWGLSAMLGHASPLTTLQVYSHAAQAWSRQWIERAWWSRWCPTPAHGVGGSPVTAAPSPARTSSLIDLPSLTLLPAAGILPERRQQATALSAVHVDLVLEIWRRTGRVDGIADRLLVPEDFVGDVLRDAQAMWARCHRDGTSDWPWIVPQSVVFSRGENWQIRKALNTLATKAVAPQFAMQFIRHFMPGKGLFLLTELEDFEQVVGGLRVVLNRPTNIELLLPGQGVRSAREDGPVKGRRRATNTGDAQAPEGRQARPRLPQIEPALDAQLHDDWCAAARHHGCTTTVLERLPARRERPHDPALARVRFGVRIRENSDDLLHSAKVSTRVLGSWILAQLDAKTGPSQ